jgi:hypothetical protein
VVRPLLQANVYGEVPPLAVNDIDPFEAPLQFTFVGVSVREIALGCVNITAVVAEQLFKSLTVTVKVPAPKPVADALV